MQFHVDCYEIKQEGKTERYIFGLSWHNFCQKLITTQLLYKDKFILLFPLTFCLILKFRSILHLMITLLLEGF